MLNSTIPTFVTNHWPTSINKVGAIVVDGTEHPLEQFSAESIDIIFCTDTPRDLTDPFEWVETAATRLKRGGGIMLSLPTIPEGLGGEKINVLQRFRDSRHRPSFSAENWQEALYAAQLELIENKSKSDAVWFDQWADSADSRQLLRLQAVVLQAPPEVAQIIRPTQQKSRLLLHFPRSQLIAVANKRRTTD